MMDGRGLGGGAWTGGRGLRRGVRGRDGVDSSGTPETGALAADPGLGTSLWRQRRGPGR
jgi:hypothetical protein